MSRTARRRTAAPVALVAVAATAAALAAIPVLHADAATRAGTSLSIRTGHPAVAPGGSDRITGDLGVRGPATAAGRTVTLEARPAGADAFVPVGTSTAGVHGGVSETVTPDVTTRYRWHYAGDTDARPSRSGVATVRVRTPQHPARRIGTTLSIRAVHHLARLDGSDVVRGRLRAGRVALRHRLVLLVSRTAGTSDWAFAGAHRTRHGGQVAFRIHPAERTAYRLVFLGTRLLRPSHSSVVRVIARPGLSIAADPHRITRGDDATVSGVASDQGAPIAGGSVKLLARRAGSHHVRVLGSATTAADGSVSFTVTPTRTTAYRLRLVHSTGVRASLSAPARVIVRRPSSLSVRGRTAGAAGAAGADFVVSGTLRGAGHSLAHRPVTLQVRAPGSADWSDAGTARTGRHGVARFREATAAGTSYRLAYAGGPRFAPSTSGTVDS